MNAQYVKTIAHVTQALVIMARAVVALSPFVGVLNLFVGARSQVVVARIPAVAVELGVAVVLGSLARTIGVFQFVCPVLRIFRYGLECKDFVVHATSFLPAKAIRILDFIRDST